MQQAIDKVSAKQLLAAGTSEQQTESKKPHFERGTKEGIAKQLQVAQQSNLTQVVLQVLAHLSALQQGFFISAQACCALLKEAHKVAEHSACNFGYS